MAWYMYFQCCSPMYRNIYTHFLHLFVPFCLYRHTHTYIHTHILYIVLSFVFIFTPKSVNDNSGGAVMYRSTSLFLLMSQNPMLWRDYHLINHSLIHVFTVLLFQIMLLWKSLHIYHRVLKMTSWNGNVWSTRAHILHFDWIQLNCPTERL